MIIVKASDFSEFDFCQYKWHKKTIASGLGWQEPESVINGRLAHEKLDKEFLKEVKLTKPLKEIFTLDKRVVNRPDACGVKLSAEIGNVRVVGKPDEIIVDKTGVFVIENKPTTTAYEGYKNQTRIYALLVAILFEEEIGERKIYAILKNTETHQIFWRELFDKKALAKTSAELIKLSLVKQGIVAPVPATSKGKCGACSIRATCEYAYDAKANWNLKHGLI